MTDPKEEGVPVTTQPETVVERVASAIANVLEHEHEHDYTDAARAALEAAQPSPAMAERQARLLLTERGFLPVVHTAWKDPLEPFCGNPDGFGPGGHTSSVLRMTCRACADKLGSTEDQIAEWERWSREGIPPNDGVPLAEFLKEAGL